MATLSVRTLRARDIARLRAIGPRTERLDSPWCRFRSSTSGASQFLSAVPGFSLSEHAFVATVDGELCAYLVVQEQPRRYQWEIVNLTAGSPRLEATDDVCIELWTALIEFAVQQAGANGVKRIFASARAGTPAFDSLRANGFGAYEDRFVMTGDGGSGPEFANVQGLRRQAESDVWSIHQLYHQITPPALQYAEALTSTEWEIDNTAWWQRLATGAYQSNLVLDGDEGVVGYCRIERRYGRAIAKFLILPQCGEKLPAFLLASARLCGVRQHDVFQIVVPGYTSEHVVALERFGFHSTWERAGLVKHTTAPVVVRPRLMPVPVADERERVIRGVPTLYQRQ